MNGEARTPAIRLEILTVLYFDCFSGASGDMILGSLIDAGVQLEDVRRALGSLAIAPDTVWTEPVVRAGIRATKFNVRGETRPGDGHHHHEHEPHHEHAHAAAESHRHDSRVAPTRIRFAPTDVRSSHRQASDESHRTLAEIFGLIDGSALSGSRERPDEASLHPPGRGRSRHPWHSTGARSSSRGWCARFDHRHRRHGVRARAAWRRPYPVLTRSTSAAGRSTQPTVTIRCPRLRR